MCRTLECVFWHCALGSVWHGNWDCWEPLLRIHWQLHQKRGNMKHSLSTKEWWCSLASEEPWLEQTADDGLISCWFFSYQTVPLCVILLMKKVQANFLVSSIGKIIHFYLFFIMWHYYGTSLNTIFMKPLKRKNPELSLFSTSLYLSYFLFKVLYKWCKAILLCVISHLALLQYFMWTDSRTEIKLKYS